MAHLTGKSITQPTQAEQERERIKAAAVARLQLAAILYDLTADTPETARAPRTDAEILEAQYKAGAFPAGYNKADFARDQAATIDRLLDPLREVYGPHDTDLQRGTAYRNYLQEYCTGIEEITLNGEQFSIIDGVMIDAAGEVVGIADRTRPVPDPDKALEYIRNAGKPEKKKRGRPEGSTTEKQSFTQILTEDGATPERAAEILAALKTLKRCPAIVVSLYALADRNELKAARLDNAKEPVIKLRHALIEEGFTRKQLGVWQNFPQTVDRYADPDKRQKKQAWIPAAIK